MLSSASYDDATVPRENLPWHLLLDQLSLLDPVHCVNCLFMVDLE